jgi:hypothetical protein
MEAKFTTIEEIRSTLDRLRQDPKTQCNFPRELWTSIIQLTKIYPVEEVCRHWALMFIRKCIKTDPVTGKKYFFYQLVESIRTDRLQMIEFAKAANEDIRQYSLDQKG